MSGSPGRGSGKRYEFVRLRKEPPAPGRWLGSLLVVALLAILSCTPHRQETKVDPDTPGDLQPADPTRPCPVGDKYVIVKIDIDRTTTPWSLGVDHPQQTVYLQDEPSEVCWEAPLEPGEKIAFATHNGSSNLFKALRPMVHPPDVSAYSGLPNLRQSSVWRYGIKIFARDGEGYSVKGSLDSEVRIELDRD